MRHCILALSLLPLFSGSVRALDTGLAEGKLFPDLWLPTLEGEQRAVSSFRGDKLLLLVYASW